MNAVARLNSRLVALPTSVPSRGSLGGRAARREDPEIARCKRAVEDAIVVLEMTLLHYDDLSAEACVAQSRLEKAKIALRIARARAAS